jgi:hypothetical protein
MVEHGENKEVVVLRCLRARVLNAMCPYSTKTEGDSCFLFLMDSRHSNNYHLFSSSRLGLSGLDGSLVEIKRYPVFTFYAIGHVSA